MKTLVGFTVLWIWGCSDPVLNQTKISISDTSETQHFDANEIEKLNLETVQETISKIGEFGSPCQFNTDCDSGFCTESPNGKVCSKICTNECPENFQCVSMQIGNSDVTFVCINSHVRLCDPCSQHSDCNGQGVAGNLCVNNGNAGNFCGISCDPLSQNCPKNFVCSNVVDSISNVSKPQCIPKSGAVCTCSIRAIQLGLKTSCSNQNFFGSCKGDRTCSTNGLTSCIGQIPEAESCNKLDDNCDSQIDNVDSSLLGSSCKRTNEFGTCTGKFAGCKDGLPICNAQEPTPEQCNGKDDDCDSETDEKLCDDGNECTTDMCNTDGSCKHTKLSGTLCNDENVCTSKESCANGICLGGNKIDCDDQDACTTDSCDPFTGCVHKPNSQGFCPDDGNACTQDLCEKGACTHPSVKDGTNCTEDGNVCTKDFCVNGACDHVANSEKCNDLNPCTLNDTCKDKACTINVPKVCLDDNPCTIDSCDPKIGCVYSPNPAWKDGLPCPDDGNFCTDDVCKGSICSHIPIPNCN